MHLTEVEITYLYRLTLTWSRSYFIQAAKDVSKAENHAEQNITWREVLGTATSVF